MKHILKKEKFFFGMLVSMFVLALGTAAQAVPSLGVGTGTFGCSGATNYWECFSGNLGENGFALPSSGGSITAWSDIPATDIWLLGEPSLGTFFTFAGPTESTPTRSTLVSVTGTIDGYVGPFQGINLGKIDGSWLALPSPPFSPPSPGFYGLTGTLTYTGTDIEGDWLFLVADIGNDYDYDSNPFDMSGKDSDTFSPKTTSATGTSVPEAGAMLMFATGLIGLVGYRRVRRMQ